MTFRTHNRIYARLLRTAMLTCACHSSLARGWLQHPHACGQQQGLPRRGLLRRPEPQVPSGAPRPQGQVRKGRGLQVRMCRRPRRRREQPELLHGLAQHRQDVPPVRCCLLLLLQCVSSSLPSSSHKTRSADDGFAFTEKSCKNSYAYAYDESSKTALFTCPSSKKADYTITFCP